MCFKPIKKKDGSSVPCNRCPKCKARRVSSWSFRLMQELKSSKTTSAHFITLTYDNDSLCCTKNGYPDLRKRHLQLFFKRLRKAQGHDGIKYYAVGEYGGVTHRPHYHIILFNAELSLIQDAWSNTWTERHAGSFHRGDVEPASIGYTLKYIQKNKKKFRISEDDDRTPEFAVMSKGLGIDYLSEQMAQWHADDIINRMYCTLDGGVKIPMPRYYKEKIYFEMEKAAIAAAYTEQFYVKDLEKFELTTIKTVWNEQQAIDAAYDRMYKSTFKTVI